MKKNVTNTEALLGFLMALIVIGFGLFRSGVILPAIIVSVVAVVVASRVFRKGQGEEVIQSVRGGCMCAIGLIIAVVVVGVLISIFF